MNTNRFLTAKRALAQHYRDRYAGYIRSQTARIAQRESDGSYEHNHRVVTGYATYLRTGEEMRRSDAAYLESLKKDFATYPRQIMALRSAEALLKYISHEDEDGELVCNAEETGIILCALVN
jgi:hypothetical protein